MVRAARPFHCVVSLDKNLASRLTFPSLRVDVSYFLCFLHEAKEIDVCMQARLSPTQKKKKKKAAYQRNERNAAGHPEMDWLPIKVEVVMFLVSSY